MVQSRQRVTCQPMNHWVVFQRWLASWGLAQLQLSCQLALPHPQVEGVVALEKALV